MKIKTKVCFRCKNKLPITNFHKYKTGVNKNYYHSYCNVCCNDFIREYYLKNPWARVYKSIITRCNDKKRRYWRNKIKNYLSLQNIKFLWFKYRAYLLKRPSIDRIDNNGNYELANCRFIELRLNSQLGANLGWVKKRKLTNG